MIYIWLYFVYSLSYLIISIGANPMCMCTQAPQCYPYVYSMNNLSKLDQEAVLQFWKERLCGYYFGVPIVCCAALPSSLQKPPSSPSQIPSSSTQSSSSSTQDPSTTTQVPLNPSHQHETKRFFTDTNNDGFGGSSINKLNGPTKGCRCLPLPQCEPYTSLVSMAGKPLKSSIIRFLVSQQCGFEKDILKVCCPVSAISIDHEASPVILDLEAQNKNEQLQTNSISTVGTQHEDTKQMISKLPDKMQSADSKVTEKTRIINYAFAMYDIGIFDLMRMTKDDSNNTISVVKNT